MEATSISLTRPVPWADDSDVLLKRQKTAVAALPPTLPDTPLPTPDNTVTNHSVALPPLQPTCVAERSSYNDRLLSITGLPELQDSPAPLDTSRSRPRRNKSIPRKCEDRLKSTLADDG